MNVHFTARQTDLTPEVRAYCEKKLKALEKLLGKSPEVDIILSVEKSRQKAEIHVVGKGMDVVVSEETSDMLSSLNQAFDDLETKIKKHREKFRETRRRKGREMKEIAPFPEEAEEEVKRILRSSHYSLKPISVEEAILLLEAKNREVFMFRKEGSEKWAAVFRRKDGHYGLVEPE
jgi:putative sigma-54 modulation protein